MTEVSLSDRVGAMAVIDEMRHREMVVNDLLNLRARRQEAVTSIEQYYKAKGVTVNAELIESGVRSYFDRRLTFEAQPLKPFTKALANLYISRGRWGMPVVFAAIAVAVITGAGLTAKSIITERRVQEVRDLAQQVEQHHVRLSSRALALNERLNGLVKLAANEKLTAGVNIANNGIEAITKARQDMPAAAPITASPTSIESDLAKIEIEKKVINNFGMALSYSTTKEAETRDLLEANKQLRALEEGDDFKSTSIQFTQLSTATKQAHDAIVKADTQGVTPAKQAVASAIETYSSIKKVAPLTGEIEEIAKAFSSMPLDKQERSKVTAVIEQTKTAITQLDIGQAERNLQGAKKLLTFAKTPIDLNITDRKGIKSGVERTYDASGGKTWYLIVDATDPAGKLISAPVRNSETGTNTYASTFGISVTRDQYNLVKAEKMKDGHIKDRTVGFKPEGSLTIKYNQRTSANPDVITSW